MAGVSKGQFSNDDDLFMRCRDGLRFVAGSRGRRFCFQ